jgi:hypothetical protein
MNYLYLIQKKEYINQDIFKVGIISENKKDNINKQHKIILLIKNEYNCINFNELIELLKKTFLTVNDDEEKIKENYFIGDSEKIMLFILQYFKHKYFLVFNKLYVDEKNELAEKICDSTVMEKSEKFNQLIKLQNVNDDDNNMKKYLDLLNFDNDKIKINFQNLLNDISIEKINNFGEENLDFITNKILNELLNSEDITKLINKFIFLVYFNDDCLENKNILSTESGLKVYKNNKWIEVTNKKKMYKKIFFMNKYRLHIIFLRWFLLNEDNKIQKKIIEVLKFF